MKKVLLGFSVFLTLLSSPMVNAASATPLTDQYIESIRIGCTDALQGMLQIQKSEAATRVNRGREYETLLRLVAAFNSRVVLNKLDAPVLTSNAAKLQKQFSEFQKHYLDYAKKYDLALDVNCKNAPVTFYDNLTTAREARAKIAVDIKEMDTILEEYSRGLETLKTDLQKVEAEGAAQ
jgi:hypothetical protein